MAFIAIAAFIIMIGLFVVVPSLIKKNHPGE